MNDDQIAAAWQQLAIHLLQQTHLAVNGPALIGTDDETGVIMMFFNKKKQGGKSTLIASDVRPEDLRQLLKGALANLGRAQAVEPETPQ